MDDQEEIGLSSPHSSSRFACDGEPGVKGPILLVELFGPIVLVELFDCSLWILQADAVDADAVCHHRVDLTTGFRGRPTLDVRYAFDSLNNALLELPVSNQSRPGDQIDFDRPLLVRGSSRSPSAAPVL